jgi:hypothetical protein
MGRIQPAFERRLLAPFSGAARTYIHWLGGRFDTLKRLFSRSQAAFGTVFTGLLTTRMIFRPFLPMFQGF